MEGCWKTTGYSYRDQSNDEQFLKHKTCIVMQDMRDSEG